jgi:hypothetical protein
VLAISQIHGQKARDKAGIGSRIAHSGIGSISHFSRLLLNKHLRTQDRILNPLGESGSEYVNRWKSRRQR